MLFTLGQVSTSSSCFLIMGMRKNKPWHASPFSMTFRHRTIIRQMRVEQMGGKAEPICRTVPNPVLFPWVAPGIRNIADTHPIPLVTICLIEISMTTDRFLLLIIFPHLEIVPFICCVRSTGTIPEKANVFRRHLSSRLTVMVGKVSPWATRALKISPYLTLTLQIWEPSDDADCSYGSHNLSFRHHNGSQEDLSNISAAPGMWQTLLCSGWL